MLINISALMQEPIGESREYGFIGEIVDDANVNCEAELMRTDVGILVSATCASEQGRTCSLCLKPYTHKMQFSFDEEFYPVIDIATGRKLPERDTIEDLLISETHHLDIADAVRQHLIMHEPQNPICKPDCAGLCPQCGADRNTVSCKCPSGSAQSEWAAALQHIWNANPDQ